MSVAAAAANAAAAYEDAVTFLKTASAATGQSEGQTLLGAFLAMPTSLIGTQNDDYQASHPEQSDAAVAKNQADLAAATRAQAENDAESAKQGADAAAAQAANAAAPNGDAANAATPAGGQAAGHPAPGKP